MPKKEYDWELDGELPKLGAHSLAKHQVVESYIRNYIKILAADPRHERLQLSIVDGFAGGGLYKHEDTGEECLGSPLLLLNAVKSAEVEVNIDRVKQFNVNADFFFVEKKKRNLEHLKFVLDRQGYDWKSDKHINIFHGLFSDYAPKIIKQIKTRGTAWRTIFVLDQYGYSDVPLPLIRTIFQELQHAEVILTFAADALINYISDTSEFKRAVSKVGLDSINWKRVSELKEHDADWRLIIQSQVSKALQGGCSANYFTPFFIHSPGSNRDYWLVHLSTHSRARDEMVKLHWDKHNHFSHPGHAGLNMLGYHPDKDPEVTSQDGLDFLFDEPSHERTRSALVSELPILIHPAQSGMRFRDLVDTTCNETPASSEIYKEALEVLLDLRDIEVIGPENQRRRKGSAITGDDIIKPVSQFRLFT